MFGLTRPKLPITLEQNKWVDDSFVRLATLLGAGRLLQATVILPAPEHFPDLYDGSEVALQVMFQRIATRNPTRELDRNPARPSAEGRGRVLEVVRVLEVEGGIGGLQPPRASRVRRKLR